MKMCRSFTKIAIKFATPSVLAIVLSTSLAAADPFFFSTGAPDGLIATASRAGPEFEIESADDFALTRTTSINSATFTGLIPAGSSVTDVIVEIYRVFPNDSNTGRTPQVPTRVNSPSDIAFASRDSASSGELTFATNVLSGSLTAANSVQPSGINAAPNQFTGGNGAVTGEEVQFSVNFTSPFTLPADHYFFVPQVELSLGDFLWLSAAKPIVPPGTPFPSGTADLQSWTRDAALDPDWLRVGTDITHQGPFNASFSLGGSAVPEPSTWVMMLAGLAGLGFFSYRRNKVGTLPA